MNPNLKLVLLKTSSVEIQNSNIIRTLLIYKILEFLYNYIGTNDSNIVNSPAFGGIKKGENKYGENLC